MRANTLKTNAIVLSLSAFAAATLPLQAGPRTSASYSMPTDTVDFGGKKTASNSYSIDTSIGGVAGIASVAAPAETAKTGYIAQLCEVTGLVLNATPLTIDEEGTRQLSAWQTLDDATFLAVPATSVTWNIVDGPLASISLSGLATAGIVCGETLAHVRGAYAGDTSPLLTLTVQDVNKDNFPGYDHDGIDDGWQKTYFGLPPNPIAGPLFDPDGDGQNNLFEFRTGYVPTDAGSRFITRGLGVSGGNFQLELSQVQPGTRYLFQRTTDFVTWEDLLTLDPAAVSAPFTQPLPTVGIKSFYRVEITKP